MDLGIFAKTFARWHLRRNSRRGLAIRLGAAFNSISRASVCRRCRTALRQELLQQFGTSVGARGIRIAGVSGTFNMIHPDGGQAP
jgi:hypothetical protein